MTTAEIRKNFRDRVFNGKATITPGAFSALSARLVEEAGFDSVYIGGAGIANNHLCWADMGLTTMTEVLWVLEGAADAVSIPIIADVDTGFGNQLNVYRTIKCFERVGVSAIHMEDQVMPKRCGHFAGKQVISKEEMVAKIKVAVDARSDPNFLIIARTDAAALEGFDSAIERAQAYIEAGADITWIEAIETLEQIEAAPKLLKAPQFINIIEGGKTPVIPLEDLDRMGYKIVVYANALSRTAIKGMQEMLQIIKEHGTTLNHWHDRHGPYRGF